MSKHNTEDSLKYMHYLFIYIGVWLILTLVVEDFIGTPASLTVFAYGACSLPLVFGVFQEYKRRMKKRREDG